MTGAVWIGYDPGRSGRALEVPCGKCIGCRLDRARGWSIRIMHEASLYDSNWFCTFTYDDAHLPEDFSLRYPDFQAMMKRLRRRMRGDRPGPGGNFPLRFFCSGEYGTVRKRPHFHAVLFNARFADVQSLANGSFRSTFAEDVWRNGGVQLDTVTVASAAYVAGYVVGKAKDAARDDVVSLRTGEISERRKEFARMSLRPGIGAAWYEHFGSDLFPADHAVMNDGKRHKVPRYYWERFREEADPGVVELLEERRFARAMECREESTPERRAVREELAELTVAHYSQREDL